MDTQGLGLSVVRAPTIALSTRLCISTLKLKAGQIAVHLLMLGSQTIWAVGLIFELVEVHGTFLSRVTQSCLTTESILYAVTGIQPRIFVDKMEDGINLISLPLGDLWFLSKLLLGDFHLSGVPFWGQSGSWAAMGGMVLKNVSPFCVVGNAGSKLIRVRWQKASPQLSFIWLPVLAAILALSSYFNKEWTISYFCHPHILFIKGPQLFEMIPVNKNTWAYLSIDFLNNIKDNLSLSWRVLAFCQFVS